MAKKTGAVKGFFGEFKKFITRGNVLDMAVGVIVGGAFTAIVNGLSNFVLKPIINWILALILGKNGLSGIYTFLPNCKVWKDTGLTMEINGVAQPIYDIDLANSIYIDWGAFINAIINFLLIAFVLFMIVRTINKFSENREKALAGAKLAKEEKKEIKQIAKEQNVSKKTARVIYAQRVLEEKEAKEAAEAAAKAEAEAKAAEEARIAEEKATANTRLLAEIRDLLKGKMGGEEETAEEVAEETTEEATEEATEENAEEDKKEDEKEEN
ncbi:MAG: large conductance mechanosensitive channel protein MscL [Clostridiales bacterium]|nr:large conductance mechanosensitive channel protein MscL [Clostridiales bacterium]